MGGRGNSAERNHKEYLQSGNFENLDEYDEEILNDSQIPSESDWEYTEYTPQQVQSALKQADSGIKSKDEDRLTDSRDRLSSMLSNGRFSREQRLQLRRKLEKVNLELDRIDYEKRRY